MSEPKTDEPKYIINMRSGHCEFWIEPFGCDLVEGWFCDKHTSKHPALCPYPDVYGPGGPLEGGGNAKGLG